MGVSESLVNFGSSPNLLVSLGGVFTPHLKPAQKTYLVILKIKYLSYVYTPEYVSLECNFYTLTYYHN